MSSLLDARTAALGAVPVPARAQGESPTTICLAAALLAAMGAALMPALHRWAIGLDRVQAAAVLYVERAIGRDLGSSQIAMVHQTVADQSPALSGAGSFVIALLAVAIGGAVLAAAVTLLGGEVTAGWTLAAAAAGHATVIGVRIVLWCTVFFSAGADGAAAIDWLQVAPLSLGSALSLDATGAIGTIAHALDLSLFVGVIVVSALLTESDRKLGWPRAVLAALAFPAVVIGWRAGMSLLLGVPLA